MSTTNVASGQFTGAFTTLRNRSIVLACQPVITLCHEIVGNDEFSSRNGTDLSTQQHYRQLIAQCDKLRKMVTYNSNQVDLGSLPGVLDVDVPQEPSLAPLSMDHTQLTSSVELVLPWALDGSDPNLPLIHQLEMRDSLGPIIYGSACDILVTYTRLESRHRSHMITVNDSFRAFSAIQTFRDLVDRLLGPDNQVDVAAPLATDEAAVSNVPNRVTELGVDVTN